MYKAAAYVLVASMRPSRFCLRNENIKTYTEFKKLAQTVIDLDTDVDRAESAAYNKAVEEAFRISEPTSYIANDENDFDDGDQNYLERKQQATEDARVALGFGPVDNDSSLDGASVPGAFGEDLALPSDQQQAPITPATPVEQARTDNPSMYISNTGKFRQTGSLPNGMPFIQAGNNVNTIKTPQQMMTGGRKAKPLQSNRTGNFVQAPVNKTPQK